jgi:hypothetical protein
VFGRISYLGGKHGVSRAMLFQLRMGCYYRSMVCSLALEIMARPFFSNGFFSVNETRRVVG